MPKADPQVTVPTDLILERLQETNFPIWMAAIGTAHGEYTPDASDMAAFVKAGLAVDPDINNFHRRTQQAIRDLYPDGLKGVL